MNKELTFTENIKIYSSKTLVWKNLVSAELYQSSWGAALSTTWQTGSSIQFTGTWENKEYKDKGVIKEYNEGSFLKFTYWSSFWETKDVPEEYCDISYAVKRLDEHCCEFVVTQVGFRDQVHYDDTVELWRTTTKALKYLSERDELKTINNTVFMELVSILESIPTENYNLETSMKWNRAQIVEHILMANSGIKHFLTEIPYNFEIPYDFNVEAIRNQMLNTEVKVQSPDFLIPDIEHYELNEHKERLLTLQTEINECIQTLDFEEKCGTIEMPPFGYMSIYEWLNFSLFHILRHKVQLKALG